MNQPTLFDNGDHSIGSKKSSGFCAANEAPPLPPEPQFDLKAAREARDAGMSLAESGIAPEWRAAATAAVRKLCETRPTFICDDVWLELGERDDTPKNARALGPILNRAAKDGWCRNTKTYVPSANRNCHANPRPVWGSLLFRAGGAA